MSIGQRTPPTPDEIVIQRLRNERNRRAEQLASALQHQTNYTAIVNDARAEISALDRAIATLEAVQAVPPAPPPGSGITIEQEEL